LKGDTEEADGEEESGCKNSKLDNGVKRVIFDEESRLGNVGRGKQRRGIKE